MPRRLALWLTLPTGFAGLVYEVTRTGSSAGGAWSTRRGRGGRASSPCQRGYRARPGLRSAGSPARDVLTRRRRRATIPGSHTRALRTTRFAGPDQQEAGADDDTSVDLPMEKTGSSARSRDASTRFEVFLDGIDPSNHSDLEASVIDLAGVGLEVARMLEVIPEESGDVYRTIDVLVGRGALKIRRAGDQ